MVIQKASMNSPFLCNRFAYAIFKSMTYSLSSWNLPSYNICNKNCNILINTKVLCKGKLHATIPVKKGNRIKVTSLGNICSIYGRKMITVLKM